MYMNIYTLEVIVRTLSITFLKYRMKPVHKEYRHEKKDIRKY